MNRVVGRGAPPVLPTLVATGLVAAPRGAAPTWVELGGSDDDHVLVPTHPIGGPWSPPMDRVLLTKKTIHVVGSAQKPRAPKPKLAIDLDATVVVRLERTAKVNGKAVKAKLTRAMKSGQPAI